MKLIILPSILVIGLALTLPACTKHDNRPKVSKLAAPQLPLRHAEDLKRVDNKVEEKKAVAKVAKNEKTVKASRKPASVHHKAAKAKSIKHHKKAKKAHRKGETRAPKTGNKVARNWGTTGRAPSLVSDK